MSGPKQGGRQDIERPDDTSFGEASRARLSANMSTSIRLSECGRENKMLKARVPEGSRWRSPWHVPRTREDKSLHVR